MKTTAAPPVIAAEAPGAPYRAPEPAPRRGERPPRKAKGLSAWMVGLSVGGDAVAIAAGLLLAFWVRFHTPMRFLSREPVSHMTLEDYRGHVIFLTSTLLAILFHMGLYSVGTAGPLRLRKVNAISIAGCLLWFVCNLALSFELNTQPIVSRLFLLLAAVCVADTLSAWRWCLDRLLRLPPFAASLQRRILFVGWSEQSDRMAAAIVKDPKHPYRIAGCVPPAHGRYDAPPPAWVRRFDDGGELKDLLADERIDVAIVAGLNPTKGELLDLVTLCEKEIVHLQIIPSCFEILLSGLNLETTSGVPVLGISRLPLDSPWNQILKRGLDIVGALVGVLLSAPLVAVFGTLVYLESPGPIFYRHRRLGLGGEIFHIVKLRSMRLDAERPGAPPGWTRKDDPRRLKIGALMRSWNIDEVPQFWNVLLGDMSLVGPRPERPEHINAFKEQVPHYNARHGIKPGITGWAQVNGLRGDTDLGERIKYDLYYMENWNLFLEFQILIMTFFHRSNAC